MAAFLFALMLVTVIDVTGRDLFNSPLRGGYELSGLMLMALFFLALPTATMRRAHITVELIDAMLSNRARRWLEVLGMLICAVTLGIVSYFVLQKGLSSVRYGEATMFLRLPLGPFALLGAASILLSALALLWRAIALLRSNGKPDTDHA
ncbi:MAG: TRAP transporter small permease [Rhodobacteraceae bacterium]|nr:TRAP transporter small permease [Paracoccaceae bacterium]